MPPPPAHRARHAIGFTVAGLVALLAAVIVSRTAQPNSAQVFAGRNDSEVLGSVAKLLFGLSGTTEFIGIVYAFLTFQRARGRASAAFGVAALWISVVAWWIAKPS